MDNRIKEISKQPDIEVQNKVHCFRSGELHHALDAGIISQDADISELGEFTDAVPFARTRKK